MPRFWATAWTLLVAGQALSKNTLKLRLRHIDAFYGFCDARFGLDSFDSALSRRDVLKVQQMCEAFYASLTNSPDYNSTAPQRWEVIRAFVQKFARHFAPSSNAWTALAILLMALKIRMPSHGKFGFKRALPATTLRDLLDLSHPEAARNPFLGKTTRARNWFILNLLLLCGLRRGEALLLEVDSLKSDVDAETGELVYWLDVTFSTESDPRSTAPSIKTRQSHRQLPVSHGFAQLYEGYVAEHRVDGAGHTYLLTSNQGNPLSAESLTKLFDKLYGCLSDKAKNLFFSSSGGKEKVSPHDLRHTCATARYRMFMRQNADRELALQRMRAFFGWSFTSAMPEHYARAAIQEDLMQTWSDLFDQRIDFLRSLPQ